MQCCVALFLGILSLGITNGYVMVRDVQQEVEHNPVEELEQLLQGNQEQLGHLSDVKPETNLVEDTPSEETPSQGDDAAQQVLEDEDLETQQQQEDQGLIYEISGPGATDLVKIELHREQCTEESIIKCFEDLNESLQRENPELFCKNAKSAVDCVTELADICAEPTEREEVQKYLDMMNDEVKYLCGSEHENESQLEHEAMECFEKEVGYQAILSQCGPVAAEKVTEQNELEDLSKNDIMCLSYKHTATCTTNLAEEKCGKAASDVIYSQLMDAINRFDDMKQSRFCNFNDDQEQENALQSAEDETQQQETEHLFLPMIRRRRSMLLAVH